MQKRIARIIIMDLACWMPVCIMAILITSGLYDPDGVLLYDSVARLLPINSALNSF